MNLSLTPAERAALLADLGELRRIAATMARSGRQSELSAVRHSARALTAETYGDSSSASFHRGVAQRFTDDARATAARRHSIIAGIREIERGLAP